jgi:hypothetical protein
MCIASGDPIIKRGVGISLTGLTPPYFCACPKPGTGFPTSYAMVFFMSSELRREVIFHFVDIPVGGKRIHCNAFIYIFMTELIFFSSDICFCESIWEEQLPRRKKNAV